MRRKPLNSAELIAQQEKDPRVQRFREEHRLRHAAYLEAQAPLLRDLAAVGVVVDDVANLIGRDAVSEDAVRVLLAHVRRPYPARVLEWIGRSLTIPAAAFAWNELMDIYARSADEAVKTGVAVALDAHASDARIHDIIALISDPHHGVSRLLFLEALQKSKLPEAHRALIDAVNDPQLAKEATHLAAKLGRRTRRTH